LNKCNHYLFSVKKLTKSWFITNDSLFEIQKKIRVLQILSTLFLWELHLHCTFVGSKLEHTILCYSIIAWLSSHLYFHTFMEHICANYLWKLITTNYTVEVCRRVPFMTQIIETIKFNSTIWMELIVFKKGQDTPFHYHTLAN